MKKISKIEKAFKNLILNTYHLPPKKILKKIKLLILFQKKGVKGVTNENFEKIVP